MSYLTVAPESGLRNEYDNGSEDETDIRSILKSAVISDCDLGKRHQSEFRFRFTASPKSVIIRIKGGV